MRVFERLLICAWAVAYAAAGAWPHFSNAPFPMAGLRKIAEAGGFNATLQIAAVLVAAGWLMVRRVHTRERLLVFQGMALALVIQGFLYIGIPFGLAFACFASIARGEIAKASTSRLVA